MENNYQNNSQPISRPARRSGERITYRTTSQSIDFSEMRSGNLDAEEERRIRRGDSTALHNYSRLWPDGAGRPSRDSLVAEYEAQGASRARQARLQTQDAIAARASAGRRVHQPVSSRERSEQTQLSRSRVEQERESRANRRASSGARGGQRDLIDGRGSIDSRAFNERSELVGYTIDATDRHEPAVDSVAARSRWNSSASRQSSRSLDNLSDTISGRSNYKAAKVGPNISFPVILLSALIVILLIVLLFLLLS